MPLSPIPPGHVAAIVTALAMDAPPIPAPLPPSPLRLRPWPEPDPAAYRHLFRAVGARWLWYSRLVMADAALQAALGEVHVVEDEAGIAIGLVEFERTGPKCRIRFLGLVPELAGRGHGRWLIAAALALAWRPQVERVDLFTCSLDHPAALPAYLRAGFVATGRTFETFPDPRLSGLLPIDCAPQIPLIG